MKTETPHDHIAIALKALLRALDLSEDKISNRHTLLRNVTMDVGILKRQFAEKKELKQELTYKARAFSTLELIQELQQYDPNMKVEKSGIPIFGSNEWHGKVHLT